MEEGADGTGRSPGRSAAWLLRLVGRPAAALAYSLDVGAAAPDLRAATASMPQARFVPLVGTHFLPLEQPDRLHQELVAIAERAGLPHAQPG